MESSLYKKLQSIAKSKKMSLNQYSLEVLSRQELSSSGEILHLLKRHYKSDLVGLVLFGSHARGTATEASDIDLLIILNSTVKLKASLYRDWEKYIASHLDAAYSPHFTHILEGELGDNVGSLWLELAMEGRVLMDTKGLIQRRLNKIKEQVSSGEYIRKSSYGVPYWTKRKIEHAK